AVQRDISPGRRVCAVSASRTEPEHGTSEHNWRRTQAVSPLRGGLAAGSPGVPAPEPARLRQHALAFVGRSAPTVRDTTLEISDGETDRPRSRDGRQYDPASGSVCRRQSNLRGPSSPGTARKSALRRVSSTNGSGQTCDDSR